MTYRGGCFCGAIRVAFTSRLSPRRLPIRWCLCSFCRKHGARSTSDPRGRLRFRVRRARLSRFDGGRLICAHCGVYVGMVQRIDGRLYGVINANALERGMETRVFGEPHDAGGQSAARKAARRRALWTPAHLTGISIAAK